MIEPGKVSTRATKNLLRPSGLKQSGDLFGPGLKGERHLPQIMEWGSPGRARPDL